MEYFLWPLGCPAFSSLPSQCRIAAVGLGVSLAGYIHSRGLGGASLTIHLTVPFPLSSEPSHSLNEDSLHWDLRKEQASYARGGSQCPRSAGDHKDAGRLRKCKFVGPSAQPDIQEHVPGPECAGPTDAVLAQSMKLVHLFTL